MFSVLRTWFGEPWGGPDTELARPFFVENLEKRLDEMTRLGSDPNASLIEAFGDQKTYEQQVPIIDALVNNNEEIIFTDALGITGIDTANNNVYAVDGQIIQSLVVEGYEPVTPFQLHVIPLE